SCALLATGSATAGELAYRVALVAPAHVAGPAALEVMAARRALQGMGIPFDTVQPRALAPHYPLALLPGPLYNTTLPSADREAIYGYVSGGGLLVATQVEGSDYFPLFGLARAEPRRDRFRIRFDDAADARWMRYLEHPREKEISLG